MPRKNSAAGCDSNEERQCFLSIGPTERQAMDSLRLRAFAQPIDMEQQAYRRSYSPQREAFMAQVRDQTILVPERFLVTFMVQADGSMMGRHLTVSVGSKTWLPHPLTVDLLACELGFVGDPDFWRRYDGSHWDGSVASMVSQRMVVGAAGHA